MDFPMNSKYVSILFEVSLEQKKPIIVSVSVRLVVEMETIGDKILGTELSKVSSFPEEFFRFQFCLTWLLVAIRLVKNHYSRRN